MDGKRAAVEAALKQYIPAVGELERLVPFFPGGAARSFAREVIHRLDELEERQDPQRQDSGARSQESEERRRLKGNGSTSTDTATAGKGGDE